MRVLLWLLVVVVVAVGCCCCWSLLLLLLLLLLHLSRQQLWYVVGSLFAVFRALLVTLLLVTVMVHSVLKSNQRSLIVGVGCRW